MNEAPRYRMSKPRRRLPPHERHAVTDSELRIADQVSDEEFFERIAMPELVGQPPRFTERGRS